MGLTSCRQITIAKTLFSTAAARVRNRHHADCRAAVERAADRYTLICDGPLRLNEPARRLLAQLQGGEEPVYGLIAPPPDSPAGFSRSVDVELLGGDRGRLRGYSSRLPREGGALVTVLELDPEQPGKLAGALVALTPREREVAALVVDGLADREIAQRLYLSRHTVSQHVKRIYRKLGVDSRVALTRLLLGGRQSHRNP
jgi:DNA-binding CsgD family transcriptional regulator